MSSLVFAAPAVRAQLGALLAFIVATSAGAQSVFVIPPPAPSVVAPAALAPPEPSTNQAVPPTPSSESTPFHWGAFGLRPHVSFGYLHGDGIQVRPGEPLTTSVYNASAGFILDMGDHWAFDYTGMRSFYSNDAFRDTFNQSVSITGGTTYDEWTLRLFHSYVASSSPLIETARQTKERTHNTVLTSTYAFGSDFLGEVVFQQKLRFAEDAPTSREWPVDAWLNYRIMPGLDVGAGVGVGFVDVEPGANMFYYRPQLRLKWRLDDKLLLKLSGGQEHRKFYSRDETHLDRFLYSAAVEYRPFRTTTLSAYADRDIDVSYFSSQVTENTKRGVQLQQRLLLHFFLTAGYERQKVHYLGVDLLARPVSLVRDDERRTVNLQLSTTFARRGLISISHQRSRNISTLDGYDFTSNQFALEIGYRY